MPHLTTEQMEARADDLGYDLAREGTGKRALYTATRRTDGLALTTTMGLAATMRLIEVERLRGVARDFGFEASATVETYVRPYPGEEV